LTSEKPLKAKGKELLQKTRHLIKESKRLARKCRKKISPETQAQLREGGKQLEDLLVRFRAGEVSLDQLLEAYNKHDQFTEKHVGYARKSITREYIESFMYAIIIALVIRAFLIEAFKIPTGSMLPTLFIGDHIFVNKFIYGLKIPFTDIKFFTWRTPKRGEVIVFEYPGKDPRNAGKDFIKRVVAVAADRVHLKDNILYVNGVSTNHRYIGLEPCNDPNPDDVICKIKEMCHLREDGYDDTYFNIQYRDMSKSCRPNFDTWPTEDSREVDAFKNQFTDDDEIVVPEGHVFVMGDNRDNSEDGRFWGFVPFRKIKGKALIIWWSSDPYDGFFKGIRWGRMFTLIH
jgi:signal peptidase I